MSTHARIHPGSHRRGFTLMEILVAVSIIIVATILIIPAFARIISSTNYSSAVNSVTATLGQARALAIQNGLETGVAFLFDIETERYTLMILEDGGAGGQAFLNCNQVGARARYAQMFHPARATSPVVLPKGTGVYGLAMSRQIESAVCPLQNRIDPVTASWYAGQRFRSPDDNDDIVTPWLFPRNDARLYMDVEPGQDPSALDAIGQDPWEVLRQQRSDPDAKRAVRQAQSFYIRFSAEGSVVPMGTGSPDDAYIEFRDEPFDRDTVGAEPYDQISCFDPEAIPPGVVLPHPNPEVWLRPVDELAVVSLRTLVEETGLRRPWLVTSETTFAYQVGSADVPDYVDVRFGSDRLYINNEHVRRIGRWIDENAEIISFNRYTGNVIRRAGQ